jgi:hypothetical protein
MVCFVSKLGVNPKLTVELDGTPATQINRIVSHPTMSLLVTAHEDKFIRIFDFVTGLSLLFSIRSLWDVYSILRTMHTFDACAPRWGHITVH